MNSSFVAAERAQVEQFFKDSALSDRPVVCGILIYPQNNIYLFINEFLRVSIFAFNKLKHFKYCCCFYYFHCFSVVHSDTSFLKTSLFRQL